VEPERRARADALFARVRRFPRHQSLIVTGFAYGFGMGKLAAHPEVRVSGRHAWRLFAGALDALAAEGYGVEPAAAPTETADLAPAR
jgi:hypothetical protein